MKISQEDTLRRENFNKFLEARPFIIQWILPNVRKIAKKMAITSGKAAPKTTRKPPARADFRRRGKFDPIRGEESCNLKIPQGRIYNIT